jgi:hypothetical protein
VRAWLKKLQQRKNKKNPPFGGFLICITDPLRVFFIKGILMAPRGIRNNNPGNIRFDGTKWMGLANNPTDGVFCVFTDAAFGIRAMVIILKKYIKTYKLLTVRQIVSRWAPSSENNTESYIKSVSNALLCVDSDDVSGRLGDLCRAIIKHENGFCPYSEQVIKQGITYAEKN